MENDEDPIRNFGIDNLSFGLLPWEDVGAQVWETAGEGRFGYGRKTSTEPMHLSVVARYASVPTIAVICDEGERILSP